MLGYSDRINHAFAFAAKYHGAMAPPGAGMDYVAHPANVAIILARYGCEQATIVAGILHHVLEETAPEHRPLVRGGLLQHVMENPRDDSRLLAAVARQDDRHVGRVGQVVHARSGRGHGAMVLGREREGVIDAVGIPQHDSAGEGDGHGMPRSLCVCRLSRQRGWWRQ